MALPRCSTSTTRAAGEWIPNEYGGRENLAAVKFLQDLNQAVYRDFPDTQTFAEESTAWPAVSRPVYVGGLGFGLKWNMGWMHDTLAYAATDPLFRRYHHHQLTFSLWYAFTENFVLPLSHDEVVLRQRLAAGQDAWRRLAALRDLALPARLHVDDPGKKPLFMGGEFGQRREWAHDAALEWFGVQHPEHRGIQSSGATSIATIARRRRLSAISIPTGLPGAMPTTPRTASSDFCAFPPAKAARCWSPATSHRCRAATTCSACRAADSGAKC
jgi:1,4-alpha-glucan branching enzyme